MLMRYGKGAMAVAKKRGNMMQPIIPAGGCLVVVCNHPS